MYKGLELTETLVSVEDSEINPQWALNVPYCLGQPLLPAPTKRLLAPNPHRLRLRNGMCDAA